MKKYEFTEALLEQVRQNFEVSNKTVATWRAKGTIPASYVENREPKQRTPGSGRKLDPNRCVFWVSVSDPAVIKLSPAHRKKLAREMRQMAIDYAYKTL